MQDQTTSSFLDLLKDKIDITQVPFSDRGSRLLVYQVPGQSRLLVKLAERLTELQPGLDTYRHRPPFIQGFSLVDEAGEQLDFKEVVIGVTDDLDFDVSIARRARTADERLENLWSEVRKET